MQQHLRHRRSGIGHPSLRPHTIVAPPRRRFRDSNGWVRMVIVAVVSFFVVWLAGSAIMNEIDGGKDGGDPWFDVPPFRQPDYRIPPPPDWVNDRPAVEPPPSSGRGRGWTECHPGQGGGWDCADERRRW